MSRHMLLACLAAISCLFPRLALAQAPPAGDKAAPAANRNEKPTNEQPTRVEVQAAKSPASVNVQGAALVDLDNDGDLDLVISNGQLLWSAGADGHIELIALLDGGLGATLTPADDTLRAQLKIANGQGLVVTQVTPGRLAAKAGWQADDVLLSAGDRPLAKSSDVTELITSPVKKPFTVEFTLLRGGERRKTSLTVTEDAADAGAAITTLLIGGDEPSFRIGVEVSNASSALRAQLKLARDQGIVTDRVVPESPALKAGLQHHDVLLTANGKPLKTSEDLSDVIRSSEGKPVKFMLVRAGKQLEVAVTPEKTDGARDYRAFLGMRLTGRKEPSVTARAVRTLVRESPSSHSPAAPNTSAAQIERMLKQIDELRESVKSLQGTVAKEQKPGPSKSSPPSADVPKAETPKKSGGAQ